MEVLNASRHKKRLQRAAAAAGEKAAENAVPSKRVKFTDSNDNEIAKVDEDADSDDANADLVLALTKDEKAKRQAAAKIAAKKVVADAETSKVSKTKQKALQKLKERQEREAKRGEVLKSLQQHAINSDVAALLKSSSKIGAGRETKKQRLSQALREERVGVCLTDHADLIVGINSHNDKESARARRRRLEREQDELEQALYHSDEADEESSEAEQEGEPRAGEEHQPANLTAQEHDIHADTSDLTPRTKEEERKGGGKGKEEDARATAYVVRVKRRPEIERVREKLPMFAEEQAVMECINDHDVVILCGATG